MTDQKEWKGRTTGTGWMHRSLVAMMRFLPLWGLYAFADLFVIPFCMLFAHKGYIAQYRFFRRRMGRSVLKSFWLTYQNHCRFAEIILDRFYVYAGGNLHFDIPHYDRYTQLANAPDGFVILSAHVGNYEAAGYKLTAEHKRFNALVYAGEAATVMENRRRMFEDHNLHMILIRKDMSHLFEISNALANGESVSIPADRIFGSNRHFDINFLGCDAAFPMGPFAIAAQREVAVLSIHVMKTGWKRYRIYIDRLDNAGGTIKQRAAALADQYAANLQNIVLQHPTQWFNYYDFWNEE